MKSNMKRIAALVLAAMLVLSMMPSALAGEYFSGSLNVGGRVKMPTPKPTTAPADEAATPAPVETAAPVEDAGETTESEAAEEEAAQPVTGVVYKKSDDPVAMIRTEPNANSKRVGKAYHGEAVTILGEENGWYYVEVGGMTGWVSSALINIDAAPEATEAPAEVETPEVPEVTEAPVEVVMPEATEEYDEVEVVLPEATEEYDEVEVVLPEATEEYDEVEVVLPEATEEYDEVEVVLPEATEEYDEVEVVLPEATEEYDEVEVVLPGESVVYEEEPTEVPEQKMTWMRYEDGSLILDDWGNPIVDFLPEGMEAPKAYMRDASGALVYDLSGNPIPVEVVEEPVEVAEPTATPEPIVATNATVEYLTDENGELVLDDYGNPIRIVNFDPIENIAVNADASLRLEGDGLSEITMTVPMDAAVTVLAIEGDWVKVEIDGVIGYIYIDEIECLKNLQGLPEEEEKDEEAAPSFKVTIFSDRRSVMQPGETVTLTSKIEGFENYETLLQWQCDMGSGFEDVAGATGDSHSFSASVETLGYDWRLIVYYR